MRRETTEEGILQRAIDYFETHKKSFSQRGKVCLSCGLPFISLRNKTGLIEHIGKEFPNYKIDGKILYLQVEKLLEKCGWIIECESPLEIYHEETNSSATGLAAKFIIDNFDKEDWE